MSTIDHVRLQHYDERHAPPSQPVLDITLVGDCLHLTVSEYDETHNTTETRVLSQIGVDVQAFEAGLRLLIDDQLVASYKRDIPFTQRLVGYAK